MAIKPVILLILNGWGVGPDSEGNAISQAKTYNFDRVVSAYPSMTLLAGGEAIGLNKGQAGNSAIANLNLGCGAVQYQDISLINSAIKDGTFFKNETLIMAIDHANRYQSNIHLFGLLSFGEIHSSILHLYNLLEFFRNNDFSRVFLHLFLDGVDVAYDSGINYLLELQTKINEFQVGTIASISGRKYAMDFSGDWNKTKEIYQAMVWGTAKNYDSDPVSAIKASYEKEIYDQDFIPTVITDTQNKPLATVSENDVLINLNFSTQQTGQLTTTFLKQNFNYFKTKEFKNLFFISLINNDKHLPVKGAFKTPEYTCLSNEISKQGLSQLKFSDAQNFAETVFYFNNKRIEPFDGEQRIIVPFDDKYFKKTKSYLKNKDFLKRLTQEIIKDKYGLIVANLSVAQKVFSNNNFKEIVKAVEITDKVIGEIVEICLSKDGICVITSDYGNLEEVIDMQTGELNFQPTLNPVPLIIVGRDFEGKTTELTNTLGTDLSICKPVGVLADVAPTILKLLKISKPEKMTGTSLI